MIIIEGLDVATSCGWAQINRPGALSSARCGVMLSEGENGEEKAGHLAMQMISRYRERKPSFVALEMPQRNVVKFAKKGSDLAGATKKETINPNALQLSALAGAAVAILDAYRIPWGLISTATWRSKYYGKGFTPPIKEVRNKKTGAITFEDDWKQAAINEALAQRVFLEGTKVAQGDAAEALAIAVCWEKCSFIPARHEKAFIALRTGDARQAA
jgi:hypothetical protein